MSSEVFGVVTTTWNEQSPCVWMFKKKLNDFSSEIDLWIAHEHTHTNSRWWNSENVAITWECKSKRRCIRLYVIVWDLWNQKYATENSHKMNKTYFITVCTPLVMIDGCVAINLMRWLSSWSLTRNQWYSANLVSVTDKWSPTCCLLSWSIVIDCSHGILSDFVAHTRTRTLVTPDGKFGI